VVLGVGWASHDLTPSRPEPMGSPAFVFGCGWSLMSPPMLDITSQL